MPDGSGLFSTSYADRLRDHLSQVAGVPSLDIFSDHHSQAVLFSQGADGARPRSDEAAAKMAFIGSFHSAAKGLGQEGVAAVAEQHKKHLANAPDSALNKSLLELCDKAAEFTDDSILTL